MERPTPAQVQEALKGLEAAQALLRSLLDNQSPVSTEPTLPSKPEPYQPSLQPFAWGKKFSPASKQFLLQTAVDFGWDPDWLPSCIAFETAGTFSPSIKNPHSSGTGLIQFMDATCEELSKRWNEKVTTALLKQMSVEQQLPWVWKYMRMMIERVGNATSIEDVYMLIYWPAAVGKPLTQPLHSKGTSAYSVNSGLDTNKDGVITKYEAGQLIRKKLAEGRFTENFG